MDGHESAQSVTGAGAELARHYHGLGDMTGDFRNRNLMTLVATHVRGPRVLDVGAGSGGFVQELTNRGFDAIGVEPNPELRSLAARLHPNIHMVEGTTARVLENEKKGFDTITMIDVLEHIEDDAASLQEMQKLLRPGGRLLLVMPAHSFLYGIRDRAYGHFRRYDKAYTVSLAESRGFRVSSLRHWNSIGVLPYLVSEKIFGRPLETSFRRKQSSLFGRFVQNSFHGWFRLVEHWVNFGFGLSIICVLEREKDKAA